MLITIIIIGVLLTIVSGFSKAIMELTEDRLITFDTPEGGDMYRFNNVTQPTNNFIVSPTFFLSDGTPSNVVPSGKISIIQYDSAQSRFNLISSQ